MIKKTNQLSRLQTLDRLKVGVIATIYQVDGNLGQVGSQDISRRLKELGFIAGEPVKILHKAFFGGEPLAVRIGQSTFALRKHEAALISVTAE